MNINDIFQTAVQIIISILCIIGVLVCANCVAHHIFENYIYEDRSIAGSSKEKDKCGSACLVLNVDEIGDKIEYYIRKIQNDIARNKYIYISKIILYSENPAEPLSESSELKSKSESAGNYLSEEVAHICEILTSDYGNVVFVKGGGSFLFSDDKAET